MSVFPDREIWYEDWRVHLCCVHKILLYIHADELSEIISVAHPTSNVWVNWNDLGTPKDLGSFVEEVCFLVRWLPKFWSRIWKDLTTEPPILMKNLKFTINLKRRSAISETHWMHWMPATMKIVDALECFSYLSQDTFFYQHVEFVRGC